MGKQVFSDYYGLEKNGKYYVANLSIELCESVCVKKDPIGKPKKRLEEINPLRKKLEKSSMRLLKKRSSSSVGLERNPPKVEVVSSRLAWITIFYTINAPLA